jgi:hypothetical protein
MEQSYLLLPQNWLTLDLADTGFGRASLQGCHCQVGGYIFEHLLNICI